MAIDRAVDPADSAVETDDAQHRQDRRPQPDTPGAEGVPSRAESRAAATAANKDAAPASDQASAPQNGREDFSPAVTESTDVGTEAADTEEERDDTGEVPRAKVATDEADPRMPSDSRVDEQLEDGRFRAVSGDGLSDDVAHAADLSDPEVERGLVDRLKRAAGRFDPADAPREISTIVDRPDFQDPKENPGAVPDRYGRPLDHPGDAPVPLFNGEPAREQAMQGRIGDCGIISALGAVAGHRPEAIRDCIRETGDGNYEVRLHETRFSASNIRYEPTGRTITLTVTPELPVFDSEPKNPAFADSAKTGAAWGPIMEKAIAGSDQSWSDERRDKWQQRWEVQSGREEEAPKGYVRLHQGSNPSERAELLTQLTGKPAKVWEFPTGYDRNGRSPDRQLIDEFRAQLELGKPILVGTRDRHPGEHQLTNKLVDGHAYEVTKVDDAGRLHLRNPWNTRHPHPLTVSEFRANIRPRYSTLE